MFSWIHPPHAPLIVAHRGASQLAPENTIAAFRRAVDDGAHAIELDVRLSRDGELVVIHDARLERTTDGRGLVRHHNSNELKKLSAGRWFLRRFASERIATLVEVLETIPRNIGINVEIKIDPRDRRRLPFVDRLIEAIRGQSGRILVTSFNHAIVHRVKEKLPSATTGLLFHVLRRFRWPIIRSALSSGSSYLVFGGTSLRSSIVHAAHAHYPQKLLVAEYTVNTRRRLERALRYGVDAIITDSPAHIFHLLKGMK